MKSVRLVRVLTLALRLASAGSAHAQAISAGAGIPVRCDGRSRSDRVAVTPLNGAYRAGDAFASAFVLTCTDPTGGTTRQGRMRGRSRYAERFTGS